MAQQYLEVISHREARNRAKREIEDTFTNKSAVIIEDTLKTWLERVVNEITDEFDDNPEGYKQPEVYKLVQREVGDGLRQATEAFYRLAIEYVNRVNQTNAFFTTRDADNVKTIATDNTKWILNKFNDYFRREADIQKNEKESEPMTKLMAQLQKKSHSPLVINDTDTILKAVKKLNSFNIESNITGISRITSTRAINFGTIDKTIQLAEVPLGTAIVSQSAATTPSISKRVSDALRRFQQTIDEALPDDATGQIEGLHLHPLDIIVKQPDKAKALELGLSSQQIIDAGFKPAEYVPRSMFVSQAGDPRAKSLFQQRDIQTYGMYITARDDKTCVDICMPLDGQIYDLTDIDNIPIPGDLDHDSHPSCRCRMILVDTADLVAMWG